ncbi:PEP-CTERM sorting domain-containing protein [Halochromatium salexigens]|uniref:PEP-CTERM sorting domain-containing protein n=1 Tax=Halochromatium salexigens TaxID=49447 RepID=UPI0019131FED|nr:PEP-CTERM sorting domain-containing protein [Halochromatium salexigens]
MLTSYSKQGSGIKNTVNQSASNCLGAFDQKKDGNDGFTGNTTQGNIGIKDTGYLNKTNYFDGYEYGAFVGEDDLLDLSGNGEADDPGWIFAAKIDFNEDGTGNTTTGKIENNGQTLEFAESLIELEFDSGSGMTSGTWTYTPPETNPQGLIDVLGANKFFDQAAVIFKSAREYAIYNFTLADLGLDPVVGTEDTNYRFSGTWDMSGTLKTPNGKNPAGLSNVSLWLRDPDFVTTSSQPTPNTVPTPGTVFLFGAGLFGLGAMRKRTLWG